MGRVVSVWCVGCVRCFRFVCVGGGKGILFCIIIIVIICDISGGPGFDVVVRQGGVASFIAVVLPVAVNH